CQPCALSSFPTRRSSDLALDSMIDHDHETLSAKLLEDDHDHDHGDSPHFLSNPFIVSEIVEGLGTHLSEIYVDISDTLLENTHRSEEHTSELQSRENLVC